MVCRFISNFLQRNRRISCSSSFQSPLAFSSAASSADCLISAFGFSPEQAARISKRLKPHQNPESILAFFKNKGATAEIVRKAISRRPNLLYADVDSNLAPKFEFFEKLGFSGAELLRIIGRNSSFLHYSLENKLIPNIIILQECGISTWRLPSVLRRSSRILGRSTASLMEIIVRVRELGFPEGSVAFEMGLHIVDSLSKASVEEKMEFFRDQGWSEEEILRAIRKYPLILGLSVKKLRNSMEFYVKEIRCESSFVAANAVLLTFSVEKRVRPRYKVYKILGEMKVPEGGWSLLSLLAVSEKDFLDRFVLRYVSRHPYLKEVYDNAGFATKI